MLSKNVCIEISPQKPTLRASAYFVVVLQPFIKIVLARLRLRPTRHVESTMMDG